MEEPRAQVLLLCGPSGCGKSHTAVGSGLPVVHLDDFYLGVDHPDLPMLEELGVPDWDDPRSWDGAGALAALERLCRDGHAVVPRYDMATSLVAGTREVSLDGAGAVVAEGVFAAELVDDLRDRGLLADAVVLERNAWSNFARRLLRDLKEQRMEPRVLWHRGRMLMAVEPGIVAAAADRGCRPVGQAELSSVLARLRGGVPAR